jgi:hypothetical protein
VTDDGDTPRDRPPVPPALQTPPESPQVVAPATPVESSPAFEAAAQPMQPSDMSAPQGDIRPLDTAEARDTQPSLAQPEDAILPAAYDEGALRDAVGAPLPKPKRLKTEPVDDDGVPKPAGRRTIVIAALAIIVGLVVATFVFLGRASSQRYVIACSTTHVTAEQGRGFPPWGSHPLAGPQWKPIALPANAECKPLETEDIAELEQWFLDVLVDRASTTLTTRNLLEAVQPNKPNPLDLAAEQLNQALLLSRAPERRDQRKEVERLLGDVQYWRATLRLRDAAAALADAARQFEAASTQRPRHVTDAADWATFLRRLGEDLQAGPSGALAVPGVAGPTETPSERPSAPVGTALPVEPDGSANEPAAAPPDAGLPTGGVLL